MPHRIHAETITLWPAKSARRSTRDRPTIRETFNREKAVQQITAGRCRCYRCPGQLSDPAKSKGGWGHCSVCQCAWQVSLLDVHAFAATVPSAKHRPVTPAKSQAQ